MLTLIRSPFHPRVTAAARKRPRSFCQNCRWQVIPKHTLDPTKSEWVWEPIRTQLTRNLSGNVRPQSSKLAVPLWTTSGLKNGIIARELISTKKKKKKRRRGMNGRTFSSNPRKQGKSHHHHHFASTWVSKVEYL